MLSRSLLPSPPVYGLLLAVSACGGQGGDDPAVGGNSASGDSIADRGLSLLAPFAPDDPHSVTRGYNTSPTHVGRDAYALDFAGTGCTTSNRPVLAPWAGTIEVPPYSSSYGNRVRVYSAEEPDCYVEVSHCDYVTAVDGKYAALGQELCLEGNEGNVSGTACSSNPGAHIHMVTVCEEASVLPEPIEGDTGVTTSTSITSTNTPIGWLPNGTLAKASNSADVYLKSDDTWHLIEDEDSFWGLAFDFADVVTTGLYSFECDGTGDPLPTDAEVKCWADSDSWTLWILDPLSSTAYRVDEDREWTTVMESWGLDPWGECTGTESDFWEMRSDAPTRLRDGTLVTEASSSAVYYVSDGIAWPIFSWDVLEAAGWGDREILEVSAGSIDDIVGAKGDCWSGAYCLTEDVLRSCGATGGGGWENDDFDGDGFTVGDGDCNDVRTDVYPGAEEDCDSLDNDCDGEADEGCEGTWEDGDQDGVAWQDDCDDTDDDVYPGAQEACDDVDSDCDGDLTDGCSRDADGDGYDEETDCDDTDPSVNPRGDEVCDSVDNDCDGDTDDDDSSLDSSTTTTWYDDGDGDGYGDASDDTDACDAPAGHVANDDDCDDTDGAVNPGEGEVCSNSTDDDCDGSTDEGCGSSSTDADGDGYDTSTDCDDADAAVNPGATENCGNSVDDDCDGSTDTGCTVEICYEPGVTMYYGELYLDGDAFSSWDTSPAAYALSGDTEMCAAISTYSGEEIKMNAGWQETSSSVTDYAAYNNWCTSIDWQGTLYVDGAVTVPATEPWGGYSGTDWSTDPCGTGGDAYFNIP